MAAYAAALIQVAAAETNVVDLIVNVDFNLKAHEAEEVEPALSFKLAVGRDDAIITLVDAVPFAAMKVAHANVRSDSIDESVPDRSVSIATTTRAHYAILCSEHGLAPGATRKFETSPE